MKTLKNKQDPLAIPENFSKTERKIAEMLTRGISPDYFKNSIPWLEPICWADFHICGDNLYCFPHVSTFHFMCNYLEYNEEWDNKFQEWKNSCFRWTQKLEEFPNPDESAKCKFCKDWLGEDTINNDTALSRDISYYTSMYTDDFNVAIVTVSGAGPTLFEVTSWNPFWCHPRMSLVCPECRTFWDFEDVTNVEAICESDESKEVSLLDEYPF